MELTSLDLSILVNEFKELEDGHVQKVYQRGEELSIEIYVPGDEQKRLIIGTDRVFLSKYKRDNPMKPPGFCMELRKHLGKVSEIKQKGFDRILEIESGDLKLICEIYGKGNFILTKENKIIGALRQQEWSDRTIKTGKQYEYPEPTTDPFNIDDYFSEFEKDKEIVREIASKLSFGGTYAEEVCNRANIDKNKAISELSIEQRDAINNTIDNMLGKSNNPEPKLYSEGEEPVRASPFALEKYSDHTFEEYESFSKAIDDFYYRKKNLEEKKEREAKYQEKRDGILRQKEQQERKLEGLKKSSKQNREKAEHIYTNYQELNKIKRHVEKALKKFSWEETQEKIENSETDLANKINSVNKRNEFISTTVNGEKIKIDLGSDLEATASNYYDKAKNSESKIESVKQALEKTNKKLDDLDKEEIKIDEKDFKDKTKKRKKKWFEKYRWFYSSEGYLILAGRDAQTNDMLVKKHMENNDLYFHADFDGGPSVVVKDGQEAGEQTRKEAAKAAVTFTKTWKAGIGADNVYYVKPEQVTQNPESGEYLKKGAFVIRGDRNYMRNVKLEAFIGPYELDEETWLPICGPRKAIEKNCPELIELKPGHKKKSEIAKKIQKQMEEYDLDLDYITRCLPPGKSKIKN